MVCDNKSVGMLVWRGGNLLLVERKKYNFGFAPPAGHLDGFSPEDAAAKELKEEVGLEAYELKLVLTEDLENPCRREGGSRHQWYVYDVVRWGGEVRPSEDETKQYTWVSPVKIGELASRLEKFMRNNGLDIDNLPAVVAATNKYADWKENPGLEPPWYVLFKELKVI